MALMVEMQYSIMNLFYEVLNLSGYNVVNDFNRIQITALLDLSIEAIIKYTITYMSHVLYIIYESLFCLGFYDKNIKWKKKHCVISFFFLFLLINLVSSLKKHHKTHQLHK